MLEDIPGKRKNSLEMLQTNEESPLRMKRSIQLEGAFELRKNDICIPQDHLQGVKIGLLQKNFATALGVAWRKVKIS